MATDRQIVVALYHRDHYSSGRLRRTFGYEAFHWAVMVTPKKGRGQESKCVAYDATDSSEFDEVTWRMNNPTMDWWFRVKPTINPERSTKYLCSVVIATAVPSGTSDDDLKDIFAAVPLPQKNQNPQQSCVTWVADAIMALQQRELVPAFEIDALKDWALAFADERLAGTESRKVVLYPKAG